MGRAAGGHGGIYGARPQRGKRPADLLQSLDSSDTVAAALLEYYKLGATSLLIRGYDPRPDAVQYGRELIPCLRQLVADYDAARSAA